MKTIQILTFLAFFTLLTQAVPAQTTGFPAEIVTALNTGDAAKLTSYLNDNVELVVSSKNDVYSKQQAVGIITDFFKTSTGNYRVYVLTRKISGKQLIQQLRIESE